jgi:predicted permease
VPDFPGFNATVLPILNVIAGEGLQAALWMLLGAVALVQLVACVNVANLLLARAATRQRELAIRRALGAGRVRLIGQALAEHAVLAAIGGAAGLLLAAWGTRGLASAAAAFVPRIDEITIDARVITFAALSSIVAGLIGGLPQAVRMSKANAGDALKSTSRGAGVRLSRGRAALVVIECAVAVVLLTGAGLLLKSLVRVMSVDPGFDARPMLIARIVLPPEAPASVQEQTQGSTQAQSRARAREELVNNLLDRITAIPNVEASGFIDDLFTTGAANSTITIPSRGDEPMATPMNDGSVSPGLFPSMRVPLTHGRYLTRDDAYQKIRALWSPVVTQQSLADKERHAVAEPVVVNHAFVRKFFPGKNPIGRKFCIDPTNKTYWYEIVGVVGDMHRQGLERAAVPEYFGPYLPSPNGRVDLLVRVKGDPLVVASMIRPVVTSTIPGASVQNVATLDAALGDFSAQRRFHTWLLTALAALALVLAAIGIYGVVRYAVAERTQEIGLRLALGASPTSVLALIMRQGITTPAIGLAIGLALSGALTRVVEHLLFNVGALDPAIFAGVALLLPLIAAAACYIPARRAARLDPVRALRLE